MKKINLHHLYYFYSVVKNKTITKSAEVNGITQAALSRQLQEFQNRIGTPLLVRDGVRKKMTPAGEQVFQLCTEIFEKVEQIESLLEKKEEL